ncbi:MAG: hypothetical protein SPL08_04715 [Pseudomonadota bacterium]|nr:hypothetical protein [Pseudomonadota bacterium]
MVFWLSVIVFIAGIMTYLFFPRSDVFQQDMYQQEGNIITFINQHQVAKDFMQQHIMWKVNDTDTDGLYAFPAADIINASPELMPMGDVYHANDSSPLNPDPCTPNATGYYTSAIACLTNCATGDTDCVNGKKMTACPSGEQYVLTYGYMPDWWSRYSFRRQAWFKAMLKRTHGSVSCGLLAYRGEDSENGLYALDNSQKYVGYQTINTLRVIPPALTRRMQQAGLNTCLPGECANPSQDLMQCTNPLQDLMLCITPFQNPYLGTPVFWWDIQNNTGTSHTNERGSPLIGTLSGNVIDSWTTPTTYTISGTIAPISSTTSAGSNDLFNLNNNTTLTESCDVTAKTCTFSVHRGSTDLVSLTVPAKRGYAFHYTRTGTQQTLTVYYTTTGTPPQFTQESNTISTNLPALSAPAFSEDTTRLTSLRIYNYTLPPREFRHNVKADQKRFGL